MTETFKIFLDTPVSLLAEKGIVDRNVLKACQAAKPPMLTAGDIARHLEEYGDFHDVPGCRRQSRITDILTSIARKVEPTSMPSELKPVLAKRIKAGKLVEDAHFDFLTDDQRVEVIAFREKHGYLPMLRIVSYFLNGPTASRNDTIMAYAIGLNADSHKCSSLADVAEHIDLSRERIRQIIQSYEFPEQLRHPRLWSKYADHSTYYADQTCPAYKTAASEEIPGLEFSTYAEVVSRISMLENIGNLYLARTGWTKEIGEWVSRLRRMSAMPRKIENRISLEGLAMGGSLDTRLSIVVLNQIAPALGIRTETPDAIIFAPNRAE